MTAIHFDWTDARVDHLHELFRMGYTAQQIAKDFGTVTRNAVIGKQHREGLKRGERRPQKAASAPIAAPPEPRRPPATFIASAQTRISLSGSGYSAVQHAAQAPLVRDLAPDSSPDAVTLMAIGAHQCRWPLGDPMADGFLFCGSGTGGGESYCGRHRRVAYMGKGCGQ